MRRVVLAEKASVASSLAQALGGYRKERGAWVKGDTVITWAVGHLVEELMPEEYDLRLKRWAFETLPFVPAQLRLKIIDSRRDRFADVRRQLESAELVVNACDAGREGELICRRILQVAGYTGPIRRLWISSYTDEAIQQGFRQLQDGPRFEHLYQSARVRSEGDWLVGINGTRAMTVRHGGGLQLTLGRVQTPVLAGIVGRELEIRRFVPEPFWLIEAEFVRALGESYKGLWFRREAPPEEQDQDEKANAGAQEPAQPARASWLSNREAAEELAARLQGRNARVAEIRSSRNTEKPPQLFDLTSLQRAAHGRYRMTAKDTLQVAQSLYEKHKLLTYPRTDSRYISKDLVSSLTRRIESLRSTVLREHAEGLLEQGFKTDRRVVDDAKVTDHHAILPTETDPARCGLNQAEAQIYELVGRQLLAALSPPALWDMSRVITLVSTNTTEEAFLTRGRVLASAGWRAIIPPRGKDKPLPNLRPEELSRVGEVTIKEDKTRPPPRYSEGSLLKFMETAGRQIEDEDLREAMREHGLGTPATRADIIEKLKRREYIRVEGKTLSPTPLGETLIDLLPIEELKSPELTGQWEKRIHDVQRGAYDPEAFREEIVGLTSRLVDALRRQRPEIDRVQSSAPELVARRRREREARQQEWGRSGSQAPALRDSGSRGSSGTPSKSAAAGPAEAKKTRKKGAAQASTKERKPAAQRTKKSPAAGTEPLGRCPRCSQGEVIRGRVDYGCSRWREGCRFVMASAGPLGKKLSDSQVKALLSRGHTRPLNFEDRGRSFKGRLVLNGESLRIERL